MNSIKNTIEHYGSFNEEKIVNIERDGQNIVVQIHLNSSADSEAEKKVLRVSEFKFDQVNYLKIDGVSRDLSELVSPMGIQLGIVHLGTTEVNGEDVITIHGDGLIGEDHFDKIQIEIGAEQIDFNSNNTEHYDQLA